MRQSLLCILLVLALPLSESGSAPVQGTHTEKILLAGQPEQQFEKTYQGGRRACVIVAAFRKPEADVEIAVYDDANQTVAKDKGPGFVAATWYPPRDAKYKIVVKNTALEHSELYFAFK